MDYILPLSIFSGISVTTSAFVALYLMLISKGNKLLRWLFVGLILSIAIRIGKSIVYYLFDIPVLGVAFGYLGLCSTGVFAWLYYKYAAKPDRSFKLMESLWFFPALLGFFFIWPFQILSAKTMYFFGTYWSLFMTSWGYYYMFKDKTKKTDLIRKWNMTLAIGIAIILISFLLQLYAQSLFEYALGAGAASLIVYALFFFLLKNNRLLIVPKGISPVDQEILNKIENALEVEKLYKKNYLTVSKFAELLDEPTYKISLALRERYGKPFPELINHFRIRDIKNDLSNPNGDPYKVEALAYDAGFSTPSAFYTAFKKETGKTPRAYQKEILKKAKQHSA